MARVDYIDRQACHIILTPADLRELDTAGELVVARDRDEPDGRALMVRIEDPCQS